MLKYTYSKWLLNTKNIVILILLAFINSVVINKMLAVYAETYQPFCIFESSIVLTNSGLIVVMLSVIYIMLMTNYPDASTDFYYSEIRTGRKEWFREQILFSIIATLTYLIILIDFVIIRTEKISFLANGWSLNVSKYGQEQGLASYIPLELFNQMPPVKAFILSIILLFLYLLFLAAVQLTGFVYGKKRQALTINIVLLIVGVCCTFFRSRIMWFFPFSHSVLWLHYDKYFKVTNKGTYASLCYLFVTTMALYAVSYRHFIKEDLDKMKEDLA